MATNAELAKKERNRGPEMALTSDRDRGRRPLTGKDLAPNRDMRRRCWCYEGAGLIRFHESPRPPTSARDQIELQISLDAER
jgi:hypothetical protein